MRPLKLIASLLCFLVLNCNTTVKELPVLSYTIDDSGQKKTYKITYEDFTNQLGANFSTENLKGKICIANFFFTHCPSICPPMRTAIISVAESFSEDDDILFISHTIDPENDTVHVLKRYAEATGISHERWQFLRASEIQIKVQAEQYMTNFKPNEASSNFYHSSYVALVDQEQYIRGFYNILLKEDVERLKTDINSLLR